jgi:hypothetical protein
MANIGSPFAEHQSDEGAVRISEFNISGLFGRGTPHRIPFPAASRQDGEPDLVIIMGVNGSGKTTILQMINGMIELDFNIFRRVPFREATLTLSTGDTLKITPHRDANRPLKVKFQDFVAFLPKIQGDYSKTDEEPVDKFPATAFAILKNLNFQLLDIHRSLALRDPRGENAAVRVDPRTERADAEGWCRFACPSCNSPVSGTEIEIKSMR